MLSESFIASLLTSNSTHTTSSSLKDVGICLHEFRPNPTIQLGLKKSTTEPNCLAVNEGHIFAAQSGKAVLHVYSRERNNHEATVPFPEKIRSLALAGEGILVLGTEGGKLILWEICTGRQVMTPATHLQPITSLVVDPTNNFILSGSEDSSVHVWSLPDLITFSKQSSADKSLSATYSCSPIRTISNHTTAITGIAVGHSINRSNIAISTSQDGTALIWEYRTGKILHTYLLPSRPLCITVDPADRAFYVGYEDGSVQLVDFFKTPSVQHILHDTDHQSTPTQLSAGDKWLPPSSELGATLCLSLSYDGTSILTGHRSGAVASWDVGRARYAASIASLNSPVTNLHMLMPEGLAQKVSRVAIHQIVKPRLDHTMGGGQASDAVPATYHINVHLNGPQSTDPSIPSSVLDEFSAALSHPIFPGSMISESLIDLKSPSENTPINNNATPVAPAEASVWTAQKKDRKALEIEIRALKRQISVHKATHQADLDNIIALRKDVRYLSDMSIELLEEQRTALDKEAKERSLKKVSDRAGRQLWFSAEKDGTNGDHYRVKREYRSSKYNDEDDDEDLDDEDLDDEDLDDEDEEMDG
ncbi:Ribosomal assembly complex component Ipi3 [Trichophyton interdigitale]|uniref:Pre-rRNA-processing protein IPI3 n=1 Tax=Trichophyton interdigitale TaxID=101480 RepID=A0A9P4YIP5_9EURO|nr:Ribosomal assembly complex component Ipi3 [Trichophyton interdigitale]KAG5205925.1 Ribosomal assembly complex component Ipi3 [Trichophyton interdigitale]KAG8205907.1 Ribosomal assembly complex component Ipi3 [Trichophyton interdigitale]